VQFLDRVFGDVSIGRLSLSYLTPNGMRSEHFQWLRYGVARAQEWDAQRPLGIYFRATFLPPDGVASGRGGADDSHALAFFWADIDYGTVGHKPPPGGLPLPPDEDAARQILAQLPAPTLIVHSGGGLYPIWQFAQPIYFADKSTLVEAKARSQHWQEIIQAKAAALGWHYGSGVGDLARLLRLPGSVNRKDGLQRPCRVIEQPGGVFPW
jgi:putative DNA primase/helicase